MLKKQALVCVNGGNVFDIPGVQLVMNEEVY